MHNSKQLERTFAYIDGLTVLIVTTLNDVYRYGNFRSVSDLLSTLIDSDSLQQLVHMMERTVDQLEARISQAEQTNSAFTKTKKVLSSLPGLSVRI